MAVLDSVPCISIKNTKWLYRGEGNANLVITIPQDRIILRFEKCDYTMKTSNDIITLREQKLKRDILFYKKIIIAFLGKVFIQPPFLGKINKLEVALLDEELLPQRPSYRLSKGIRHEIVTIHPDYTFLPPVLSQYNHHNGAVYDNAEFIDTTYCIEIKPKQGWVFPADRLHPKCTYCLNQYLKVRKKRVMKISQYCPLDLFSGSVARMKKAVKNLIITPQNNLKIFKNGKLVYSDDTKGNYIKILKEWLEPVDRENGIKACNERLLDKWSGLVAEALMRELTEEPPFNLSSTVECANEKHNIYIDSPLSGVISSCDWSTCKLPRNCILQRILMIQKLQEVPFPILYELFLQRKTVENDFDYVERLLNSSDPPDQIARYLLATTAKDCSIFIAFQRTQLNANKSLHYIQDCDGTSYFMNIGISDIDPKPLSCIEKHNRRDQDVVCTIVKHLKENGSL